MNTSTIKTMRVWKWALLLVVSLVLAILMYSFAQLVFLAIDNLWVQSTVGVVSSIAMIGLYALFVKWFEKHKAMDIPLRRFAQDTAKGLGVGFGFFVGVVLIMMLLGLYRIDSIGTDKPMQIVSAFFLFLIVGHRRGSRTPSRRSIQIFRDIVASYRHSLGMEFHARQYFRF